MLTVDKNTLRTVILRCNSKALYQWITFVTHINAERGRHILDCLPHRIALVVPFHFLTPPSLLGSFEPQDPIATAQVNKFFITVPKTGKRSLPPDGTQAYTFLLARRFVTRLLSLILSGPFLLSS